ncbi:MAG: hypothetical protein V1697_00690 [Candidatus Levyibacteriota bacterium]
MMGHFCKGLDCNMENQGDELVITIKGDKEKIAKMEKKMEAMKVLYGCGEDNEECC